MEPFCTVFCFSPFLGFSIPSLGLCPPLSSLSTCSLLPLGLSLEPNFPLFLSLCARTQAHTHPKVGRPCLPHPLPQSPTTRVGTSLHFTQTCRLGKFPKDSWPRFPDPLNGANNNYCHCSLHLQGTYFLPGTVLGIFTYKLIYSSKC